MFDYCFLKLFLKINFENIKNIILIFFESYFCSLYYEKNLYIIEKVEVYI